MQTHVVRGFILLSSPARAPAASEPNVSGQLGATHTGDLTNRARRTRRRTPRADAGVRPTVAGGNAVHVRTDALPATGRRRLRGARLGVARRSRPLRRRVGDRRKRPGEPAGREGHERGPGDGHRAMAGAARSARARHGLLLRRQDGQLGLRASRLPDRARGGKRRARAFHRVRRLGRRRRRSDDAARSDGDGAVRFHAPHRRHPVRRGHARRVRGTLLPGLRRLPQVLPGLPGQRQPRVRQPRMRRRSGRCSSSPRTADRTASSAGTRSTGATSTSSRSTPNAPVRCRRPGWTPI